MDTKYLVWFEEVDKNDTALVGGKGSNLGEMIRSGIPIPYGFIATVHSYDYFIEKNKLKEKISQHIKLIDYKDPNSLDRISHLIKKEILKSPIPEDLGREIIKYYYDLPKKAKQKYKHSFGLTSLFKDPLVAIRSSATAEDLPGASFAGQQATFLDVRGEANLLEKIREAWASLFEPRAIFYRNEKKIDQFKVKIAVPVQLMVKSQTSGVMFTIDPMGNDKNRIIIEGIYGLGELIVQGEVTPDHFEIDKKTFSIVNRKISSQAKMMVKSDKGAKKIPVPEKKRDLQKISDEEVLKIAKLGSRIEKHYFFPQDIEWAIEDDIVYIVQSRPVTTIAPHTSKESSDRETKRQSDTTKGKQLLLKGDPASPGLVSGPVKILKSAKELGKIVKGDILVTEQTNPDFVPAMKKAGAIVTEKGGRTSHAAIVSRELGIPAIVGTDKATKILKTGEIVTVNGQTGEIFKGGFLTPKRAYNSTPLQNSQFDNSQKPLTTATRVYVNLASPDRAKEVSRMNVNGVGLLRAEFMIADIGVHPKKLIKEKRQNLFVNKLATKLLTFCESFSPRPVVYRATDFKTNEYRDLVGGHEFEPIESNPMLGYRGAYRYMADPAVFELELAAIKMVRNKLGFKNLWLMIPFVRTVHELIEVKKIVAASGLLRSESFKLWMMVEIPSNVIILDKFCEVGIDGVSIGSNDLTMLILGTDRDNSEVATEFDERNEAVLWAIERIIKVCHQYKITSSICGQAPSDYPDLVEKLINWGITSVSVNPDAVERTREIIYNFEKKLVLRHTSIK